VQFLINKGNFAQGRPVAPEPCTQHPKPQTPTLRTSTLNPKPKTLNPQPSTLKVAPEIAESTEMQFDLVLPQLDEGENVIEFIVWDEVRLLSLRTCSV